MVRGSLHPYIKIRTDLAVHGSMNLNFKIRTNLAVHGSLHPHLKTRTDLAVYRSLNSNFKIRFCPDSVQIQSCFCSGPDQVQTLVWTESGQNSKIFVQTQSRLKSGTRQKSGHQKIQTLDEIWTSTDDGHLWLWLWSLFVPGRYWILQKDLGKLK